MLQLEVVQTPHEPGVTSMQTVESLKLLPVWVEPDHLVASARILLQGHGLRVMSVVDGGHVVGTVALDRVLAESDFLPVQAVMDPLRLVVEASESTREIAQRFVQEDLDFAPVVKEGRLLGIVTANMLLRELGRSWDPLTGLSWSDRLREWGIENLKRGNEVTILFLDLDDFGNYNKRYGHIVGDRVLRRMASFLQDHVDPERDVLVRYGGDEFAIGTIRAREDAQSLAELLQVRASDMTIPDAGQITFSVGIYGGKRTRERENVHFAATLDNLINLASKDCIANKRAPEGMQPTEVLVTPSEVEPVEHARPADIRVISVITDESSPASLTQVILRSGGQVFSGVSALGGRPAIQTVASATVKALERIMDGVAMSLGEINLTESKEGQRLVSVSGQMTKGDRTILASGVEVVGNDLYSSAAEATVQAFIAASQAVS